LYPNLYSCVILFLYPFKYRLLDIVFRVKRSFAIKLKDKALMRGASLRQRKQIERSEDLLTTETQKNRCVSPQTAASATHNISRSEDPKLLKRFRYFLYLLVSKTQISSSVRDSGLCVCVTEFRVGGSRCF